MLSTQLVFLPLLVLACVACAPRVPDDVGLTFGAGDLNRPSPSPYVAVSVTWHPNPVHVVLDPTSTTLP